MLKKHDSIAEMISRIKIEIRLITPDQALEWLTNAKNKNRALKPGAVAKYIKQMVAGGWLINGQTIVFGDPDELLDGQHRLHACVESGISFYSIVVIGIDPAAFVTIDSGRARTAGDVLAMENVSNANAVAAAVRWVMAVRAGSRFTNIFKPSSGEVLDYISENPGIVGSTAYARKVQKILRGSIGGALHFLFSEKSPPDADKFFDDLASGAGLSKNDGVFVLREKLIAQKGLRTRFPDDEVVALVLRAWMRRRLGVPTKSLRGMTREKGKTSYGELPGII